LFASANVGVSGIYVSYENPPRSYAAGQPVPVRANKLLSSDALEALDYSRLPYCPAAAGKYDPVVPRTTWQKALSSLHGDAWYEVDGVFNLRMLENRYCEAMCLIDPHNYGGFGGAILQGMHYDLQIDGLPVAYRYETDSTVTIRYWGGIPVGRRGPSSSDEASENPRYAGSDGRDLFLYNHLNVYITYWRVPSPTSSGTTTQPSYRVVKTVIQPLSIAHRFDDAVTSATAANGTAILAPPSCATNDFPTLYSDLRATPPQLLWLAGASPSSPPPSSRPVLFTYDVVWVEYRSLRDPYHSVRNWMRCWDGRASCPAERSNVTEVALRPMRNARLNLSELTLHSSERSRVAAVVRVPADGRPDPVDGPGVRVGRGVAH
jgi:hypothetical protein